MAYPEIKIAKRLAKKHGVKPPVDILALVAKFAEVEETVLPVDADAISINLKNGDRKPQIFINRFSDDNRKRFTLAHELGHIVIPWHVGSIISHINGYQYFVDHVYAQIEAEANRFASEILLPSEWLEKKVKYFNGSPIDFTKRIAQKAKVSFLSTSISVLHVLPSGYVFAVISEKHLVVHSGRTIGTVAQPPEKNEKIKDIKNYYPGATEVDWENIGPLTFVWWHYAGHKEMIQDYDEREWREVINTILNDIGVAGEDAKKLLQRMNGVIGGANSMNKQASPNDLYQILLQKFSSLPHLKSVAKHQDFKNFITKRVLALRG